MYKEISRSNGDADRVLIIFFIALMSCLHVAKSAVLIWAAIDSPLARASYKSPLIA